MIGWAVRGLLAVSGAVTEWFVAEDALNFEIVQMAVALIMLALVVFVLAYWPRAWTLWLEGKRGKE
jgi:hypothetical protein